MKHRLVSFDCQLNHCCNCAETVLVMVQFVAKLSFQHTKLFHPFIDCFMSSLNGRDGFAHPKRVTTIDKAMLVNVGANIRIASIAFVSKCPFLRKLEFVLQLVSEDFDVWVCSTSIGTIDVDNG